MLDEKGNLLIVEAILAVVLMMSVFLIFNYTISLPDSNHSPEVKDVRTSQDIMETLGGKINFTDRTFLQDISEILKGNKNSKESVEYVSRLCDEKFDSLNLRNYRFTETNVLNDEVLSISGDYSKAKDVTVATRSYGEYSFTLSTW